MKVLKYFLVGILSIVFAVACNEGIDPISNVDPGQDKTAPVISIISPAEGMAIEVDSLIASVRIQFVVTDDIELKSISVLMDGVEIKSYSSFMDYRRALGEFLYTKVATGAHVLTIKATDLEGKVTQKNVNFVKKPPYTVLYSGEVFYMPFNGDFVEKITFKAATKFGNPGFTDLSLKGIKAYAGATDSYLTFPMDGLKSSSFSGAFWYKVNPSPDRSGIISVSPVGEDRSKGFRLFREGGGTAQRIKLNVGTGAGETWNDGQEIAAPGNKWVHIAFTISASKCIIYINGGVARESAMAGPIDWTGCTVMGIASGAPNFTYWGHSFDKSQYDELRFFNKELSQAEIQTIIQNDSPYIPRDGEIFYMPFEGSYKELISKVDALKVGAPLFAAGKAGSAYAGAANSYITFPVANIAKPASFSAAFWYKVNGSPDRSGIINASPAGEDRTKGFRLFREGSATKQRIKLNVGTGAGETWNDGAELDAPATEWVHVAFTISASSCVIYFNGVSVRASDLAGPINWTGCDLIGIGSGAPNFTYWDHKHDLSQMDELHFFNKALTAAEVLALYNAEK